MKVGLVGWRGMVGSVLMQRMVEENDFAHFSIPRNGTGTDGQPGQRDAARTQKYDFASMSALEIHELCESDPNARGEFDRMLESLYR